MKRIGRDGLLARLDANGWCVDAVVARDDLDWWAAEVWRLKSSWSPQAFTLFLTWLVDPMNEPRAWRAVASLAPLADRFERGIGSVDASPFLEEADAFCAALARVRDEQ
jgi:hypothetical protein